MKSREIRDYRMNENNRDFETLNDDKNNDRNFIINATALAAAGLTLSSKFQTYKKIKESIYQQSKQNNLEKFEHDRKMTKSSLNYKRQIINLTKVYFDEIKYEKLNNNFHFKIIVFHETCQRVEVFDKIKIIVFFIMLKNSALKYYYTINNVDEINIFFEDTCNMIKTNFEEIEYTRSNFIK